MVKMNRFLGEGTRRLLIVEDQPELRKDLVQYFELKGFEVTQAPTAKQAIDIIQAKGIAWDYMITDYSMHGMNGSDLIIWCSIWKVTVGKTVLLSGNPPAKSKCEQLMKDFGVSVLTKPVPLGEILETLTTGPKVETA
jgi:DNA-binding response OmpR family regulator